MKKISGLFFLLAMIGSSAIAIAQTEPRKNLTPQLESEEVRVNAIYPAEGRLVIDDQEMFVKRNVTVNGRSISGNAFMAILREGQKIQSVKFERVGKDQKRFLIEVEIL